MESAGVRRSEKLNSVGCEVRRVCGAGGRKVFFRHMVVVRSKGVEEWGDLAGRLVWESKESVEPEWRAWRT